jgi:diguanylate cyclase (GGDEF)-like protein
VSLGWILDLTTLVLMGVFLVWALSLRAKLSKAGDNTSVLEKELASARRDIEQLDRGQRFISRFVRELPLLSQELHSGLRARRIPVVLVNILTRTFQPRQAVVVVRRRKMDAGGQLEDRLQVVGMHPSDSPVKLGANIAMGQGELGYVAESQRAMTREDLQQETAFALQKMAEGNLPGFQMEVAAPMVFDGDTVGLLAVSGLKDKPEFARDVLRLIAQMGALTYYNVAAYKHMKRSADLDKLTGVLNKASIQKSLSEEILEAEKRRSTLCIFLFDIDNFKNYNDVNGHLPGDKLLSELARLVCDITRAEDVFGRFGGEEFLLVLPDTDMDDAVKVAEKVRREIEGHDFAFADRQPLGCISVSGGVAGFPKTARDSAGLVRAADEALYEAKSQGRNRVVVASPKYFGVRQEA